MAATNHPTVHVTDASFTSEIEQANGLVLVDFWATWCGPCQIVAPILEQLAGEYVGRAKVTKVVAAEDTRRTRGLLSHLGASPTLLSFHAHSGESRMDTLLEVLGDGRDVALVTDAGTPGVSDPGADLVSAAREAGFTVVPIPGPSAVATALSAAGISADRYLFLGFVPRKGAERTRL